MASVVYVATRTAMAALPSPAVGQVVFLSETPREGFFECLAGGPPVADTLQGLYVASNTSGFYYARLREAQEGRPEWFGAIVNNSSFDCRAAIQASLSLCQTTLMSGADYYIFDTLIFDQSGKCLFGTKGSGRDKGVGVPTALGTPGGTRIILTGPNVVAATVLQFGKTSGTNDDASLTRNSYMRDILVARDCSTYKPRPAGNDPINGIKGVIMSYMNRCGMENVSSFDSPIGFHYFGVVASYSRDCDASRTTPASSSSGDLWVGHLVGGYQINYGYIGSNASIYLQHPTCYDSNGSFGLSIGLRLFGYIADTFIENAEVGRVTIGIEIDGRDSNGNTVTYTSGPASHQDVRLSNCVIDGVGLTGLQIRNLNRSGQISVDYLYAAVGGPGTAINVFDLEPGASIDFTGGKLIGSGGTGVNLTNAYNTSIRGLYIRDYNTPVTLSNTLASIIEPKICNYTQSASAAIQAVQSHRNIYRPQIMGIGARFGAGISFDGTCDYSSIDPSAIDYGVFTTVSPAYKVRFSGTDARSNAAFSAAGNVLIGATG